MEAVLDSTSGEAGFALVLYYSIRIHWVVVKPSQAWAAWASFLASWVAAYWALIALEGAEGGRASAAFAFGSVGRRDWLGASVACQVYSFEEVLFQEGAAFRAFAAAVGKCY